MNKHSATLIASSVLLLGAAQAAQAHISFTNATVYANKSFVVTANIPHGCEDQSLVKHDTIRVEMTLPAAITNARPADAAWGAASVTTNGGGNTVLVWEKTTAPTLAQDTNFYQVTFRATAPNTPLVALELDTTQFCEGGTQTVWAASAGLEAPVLNVLPARVPGWNKYTAQADIDLATITAFFGDALIVWSNNAAYSANPNTAALITTPLTAIPAGQDYWVKY